MSKWRALVAVGLSEPISEAQAGASLHHLSELAGCLGFNEDRRRVEVSVCHDYATEAEASRELTVSVLMALAIVGATVETVEFEAAPVIAA